MANTQNKKSKGKLVTRVIPLSIMPNSGKEYDLLTQHKELQRLRDELWLKYGSFGTPSNDKYAIRNALLKESHDKGYNLQQRVWRMGVEDTLDNINSAKQAQLVTRKVYKKVARKFKNTDPEKYKHYCELLNKGMWHKDWYLNNLVRRVTKRVKPKKGKHHNPRITFDSDSYNVRIDDKNRTWVSVMSTVKGKRKKFCLGVLPENYLVNKTIQFMRENDGSWYVHVPLDESEVSKTVKPSNNKKKIGIDAGTREGLVDSDGQRYMTDLGKRLDEQNNKIVERDKKRAKLRKVRDEHLVKADTARKDGRVKHARKHEKKADNITKVNLGDKKKSRDKKLRQQRARDMYFRAVHQLYDKTSHVVAEDLTNFRVTKGKSSRSNNRRSSSWKRSALREALVSVSRRRGSTVEFINPAYTSQQLFVCGHLGVRKGTSVWCVDTHCPEMGLVYDSEINAALVMCDRSDHWKDIELWMSPGKVRSMLVSGVTVEDCPTRKRIARMAFKGVNPESDSLSIVSELP